MAWCQWAPEATSLQDGKAAELPGEMLEVGAGQGWGGQPLSSQLGALLSHGIAGSFCSTTPSTFHPPIGLARPGHCREQSEAGSA